MNKAQFFKSLLLLASGLWILLFALSYFPVFQEHQIFIWSSWGMFFLFTIGVYFFAEKAAYSPNLHTFSAVSLGVIFIKMVFILILVIIYKEAVNPSDIWFLIPFFIIYLCFTIFEVYFMSKLGRIKPPAKQNQSS